MKTRMLLLVSVFLSAAVLTVIGGIVSMAGGQNAYQATATAQTNADMQATLAANYQSLLDQANQTINQANSEINNLQTQLQQQSGTPAAATTTPYPILADQAGAIANNVTGEVMEKIPRLVNYNGQAAYEVVFSNGNVYVDAASGAILYNGVAKAKTITADQAAQIAMNYSGNNSVAGVVTGLYNGEPAFQVTFQNGEIVYVDINGTVLAIQLPSSLQKQQNTQQTQQQD